MTYKELINIIRENYYGYTYGSYPLYFVTNDCSALSFNEVKGNLFDYARRTRDHEPDGIHLSDCNWENPDLYCDVTGEQIESAYADLEE